MKTLHGSTLKIRRIGDDADDLLFRLEPVALPPVLLGPVNPIFGTGGNDTLSGTAGDDKIEAGLGNDFINGSAGSDTIGAGYYNSGSTWRYGFYDNDTVDYRGLDQMWVVADLQTGTVQKWDVNSQTQVGVDTLSGVDNLSGTDLDDTLSGRDYWDFETFRGYSGQNTIDGRGGNDAVDYSWANVGQFGRLEVSLAAGFADLFDEGSGAQDQLRQIEFVTGTQGSDSFNAVGYGATSTNRNSFGEDYNLYNPLGGNDTIFGNGNTILSLAGAAGRLTVNLGLLTDGTRAENDVVGFAAATGAGGNFAPGDYLISGIAQVRGGAYDDTLLGGGRTNGNGSAGTVSSDNSFEGFRGNGGDDFIDGKTGFDRADYSVGNQIHGIEVQVGAGIVRGDPLQTGNDTLRGIEAISGTYGEDYYTAVGFTLSNAGAPSANSGDVIATAPVGETLASNAFNEFRPTAGNDYVQGNGATRVSFQNLFVDQLLEERSVDIAFTGASAGGGDYGWMTAPAGGRAPWHVDFTGVFSVRGSAHADRLVGAVGHQHLAGYYGNDELYGGDGADTLFGHVGGDGAAENRSNNFSDDDKLYGGAGSDLLRGDFGDDVLDGGTGTDRMEGGTGWDDYFVDAAGDVVVELAGAPNDFDRLFTSVSYTVPANVESLFLTGVAAINGTGNAESNYITGNSAANVLNGGAGADSMYGGLGNDTYYVDAYVFGDGANSDKAIEVSTLATEIDTVISSAYYYILSANVENLTLVGNSYEGEGNDLNNVITGSALANVLSGGNGNDTLNGGAGIDDMYGESGNDTYYVDVASDRISESTGQGTDIVYASASYSLASYATNAENLTLTGALAINGTGNTLANVITGNAAANVLSGGDGADTLNGAAGIDTMIGGLGNDTYFVDVTGDVVSETSALATEIDLVYSSATFTLGANVERLTLTGALAINATGNTLANLLTGNAAANILNGSTGIDTMIGGLGNDTYYVDVAGDAVSETSALATEIDLVYSAVTYTLGANVERLTLIGAPAINATGNTLANLLTGNAAANVLNGSTGIDTMIGGLGNDTYYVDVTTDVVSETSVLATEIDLVYSAATYTLGANVERLTLIGALAVNGTGNTLANLLTGNVAANILNGSTGIDTMIGGQGNDTYYVDVAGDVVSETSALATEIDLVYSAATYTLGANVERLTLIGALAINASGNTLANLLTGNAAANILNGSTGIDTMIGGLGNDTYYVDVAGDVVSETSTLATEIDTVLAGVSWIAGANIENLTLTGALAINGTGNTLVNTITGNTAANILDGGLGNDILAGGLGNDILLGGLGNDRLTGGTGLDYFRFTTLRNATTNLDTITDFLSADDRIDLDDAVFAGIGPVGQLAATAFVVGAAALDASDRVIYNQATGKLYYDADGNGAGAAIQFAALNAGAVITLSDLWVI